MVRVAENLRIHCRGTDNTSDGIAVSDSVRKSLNI